MHIYIAFRLNQFLKNIFGPPPANTKRAKHVGITQIARFEREKYVKMT